VLANADQPDAFWLTVAQQLEEAQEASTHPQDSSSTNFGGSGGKRGEAAARPRPNPKPGPGLGDSNTGSTGGGDSSGMLRRFRAAGKAVLAVNRFSFLGAAAFTGSSSSSAELPGSNTPPGSPSISGSDSGGGGGGSGGSAADGEAAGEWASALRAEPMGALLDAQLGFLRSPPGGGDEVAALAWELSAGDLVDVDLNQ